MPLPRLTPHEQSFLLDLARRAAHARLAAAPAPGLDGVPERLQMTQAAFVTLRLAKALRGCVGTIPARDALAATVRDCAAAAATEDPRFDALAAEQMTRVTIEITALDSPFRIATTSEIVIGVHGLMVSDDRRSGVLLPQVAVEHGWDASTFLEQTCLKAGLTADAWLRGARIEAFGAQIFAEPERSAY